MKKRIKLFIILLLFSPAAFAQKDTLVKKLDSLSVTETKGEKGKNNDINQGAYNDSTKFTFRNYFILLGSDFKQQVTFPFHAKKKDWTKFGIAAALGIGLSFADKSVNDFFADLAENNKPVASASNFITSFGGVYEVASIAGFTAAGLITQNEKIKSTAFLATQAYITTAVMETIFKYLSNRQRPNYINPKTNTIATTFHGPFYKLKPGPSGSTNSSFPSGHTAVVFAASTVYAMEYRHHPWIPVFSYSIATLVGISRMTENKHWPTDLMAGAALGLLCGRQVVDNYHRYMKIKQPEARARQKKRTLSFNLSPFYGKMLPGFTYNF